MQGRGRALLSCGIHAQLHSRWARSYNQSHPTVEVAASNGRTPVRVGVKVPSSGKAEAQLTHAGLSCMCFFQARPSSLELKFFQVHGGFINLLPSLP